MMTTRLRPIEASCPASVCHVAELSRYAHRGRRARRPASALRPFAGCHRTSPLPAHADQAFGIAESRPSAHARRCGAARSLPWARPAREQRGFGCGSSATTLAVAGRRARRPGGDGRPANARDRPRSGRGRVHVVRHVAPRVRGSPFGLRGRFGVPAMYGRSSSNSSERPCWSRWRSSSLPSSCRPCSSSPQRRSGENEIPARRHGRAPS